VHGYTNREPKSKSDVRIGLGRGEIRRFSGNVANPNGIAGRIYLPQLQCRLPLDPPHEREYSFPKPEIYKSSLMLDFAGIGINMAFSPIPAFYYTLYCNWDIGFLYIFINIFAGTVSFISNLFDWTHRKENAVVRFSILATSSVSCAVALGHIVINEFYYGNFGDAYSMVPSLYFYIPTLLCYMMGFFFYLSRYHCVDAGVPRGGVRAATISAATATRSGTPSSSWPLSSITWAPSPAMKCAASTPPVPPPSCRSTSDLSISSPIVSINGGANGCMGC
jgi:hypothetical protein